MNLEKIATICAAPASIAIFIGTLYKSDVAIFVAFLLLLPLIAMYVFFGFLLIVALFSNISAAPNNNRRQHNLAEKFTDRPIPQVSKERPDLNTCDEHTAPNHD